MMPMARSEEPSFLREHGLTWTQRWVDRRGKDPAARFDWPQLGGCGVGHLLLEQLLALTLSHCAYCDHAPLGAGSDQTIDHFRPKSDPRFLHLAFAWGNLFPCCNRCQRQKADEWDESLLKPDAEDYSFPRYFLYNPFDGGLFPNPMASDPDQHRAATTIRVLDMNSAVRRQARMDTLRRFLRAPGRGEEVDARESYRFLIEAH